MSKTKGFILAAGIMLAMAFTFSCSFGGDDNDDGDSTIVSNCDGMVGNIVTIGTQTWMAENLNCNVKGSRCYNDDPSNCEKYGRLYNWATAMSLPSSCNSSSCSNQVQSPHRGICPSGWHIPTSADWDNLLRFVDNENNGLGEEREGHYHSETAGNYLKAANGWDEHSGEDIYGFAALPGGYGTFYFSDDVSFDDVDRIGIWWSTSEGDASNAYKREMINVRTNVLSWGSIYKSVMNSVRCVQD